MFACPLPWSSPIQQSLAAIRDALFGVLQNDFKLITVDTLRLYTRIWRVVTLIQRVIERTPTVLPFFLPTLVLFSDQLLSLFAAISTNPKTQGCRYSSAMETVISLVR